MTTFLELSRDSFYSLIFHLAPRFANTILFILVARLAGPAEAGIFSLAITYLVISTTVMRGLDDLVVRQVSREPNQAGRYLTSFLLLRLLLSSVLYAALVVVVQISFDYSPRTSAAILILALSLVPDSLTYVAQSVFLGLRHFDTPAAILASISSLKLIVGATGLIMGLGLEEIAWLWPIGSTLGTLILIIAVVRRVGGLDRSEWFDWRPLARYWRAGISFLFITTLGALETQTDTLILSGYHGEAEVGWYGAAATVVNGFVMFSQAYRFAVYPLMARYALQSPEKLTRLYAGSIRYLGAFILPIVAGITLLSPQIVYVVFGSDFGPTAWALRILVLSLLFMFLNEPNVRMMLVQDRQSLVSLFLIGSVTTNLALNLTLVPSHGAVGAAVARVSSALVFFVLNLAYVTGFFEHPRSMRALARPLVATSTMVLVLWVVQDWSLLGSIVLGALTYGTTLRLVGGISPQERAALRHFLTRERNRSTSLEK